MVVSVIILTSHLLEYSGRCLGCAWTDTDPWMTGRRMRNDMERGGWHFCSEGTLQFTQVTLSYTISFRNITF